MNTWMVILGVAFVVLGLSFTSSSPLGGLLISGVGVTLMLAGAGVRL